MVKVHDNPSFIADEPNFGVNSFSNEESYKNSSELDIVGSTPGRENWGKGIEFLLSCIAMSVGLGNVWRFPFVALANGGGAFVIPYILILFLVGKPGYFLEMIMGQFSSRGTVKVFDCVPAMRGVGIGQMFAIVCISTYYSSIMAMTLRYFFYSFNSVLPWSVCDPKWIELCYPSGARNSSQVWPEGTKSSTELYYLNEVLHVQPLANGIGVPNWNLVGFLILAWVIVFFILFKGIRTSGKFSYITGIAPFIFLIIFLIRALTLPGAYEGIKFFFTPDWKAFGRADIWYAACSQLFFSLNVFFANIIMYSSYNKFNHKIYRDANIVTTLDTLTSILAGCITFGIVGHLAHELNQDITSVIKGGPGLVFVTYAETISKFSVLPQFFSVMFFLMLFILGMGSLLAMTSCVITVVKDKFNKVQTWHAALGYSIFGVLVGMLYTTPSGQSILNLVDHYGATFVIFMLAVFEMYAFCYIYGVHRIRKDVQFMLGYLPGLFWTICWWFVTPAIMTAIMIYSFVKYQNPDDDGVDFPFIAHVIGWCITTCGLIWLPLCLVWKVMKQKDRNMWEKIKSAFRPTASWGPMNEVLNAEYKEFMKTS